MYKFCNTIISCYKNTTLLGEYAGHFAAGGPHPLKNSSTVLDKCPGTVLARKRVEYLSAGVRNILQTEVSCPYFQMVTHSHRTATA